MNAPERAPGQCDVPWCRTAHRPGSTGGHAAVLGVWHSGVAVVELFMGMADGYAPVVRIAWGEPGATPKRVRDLDPELAAELGDVLAELGIRDYQEFGLALRRAGNALDA